MNSESLLRNNVHVFGNPAATETLVFAHGYGSNQTAWRFITPAFQERYRLVLFDLVGCGESDIEAFTPIRYDSLHDYARDLIEICNDLQLKRAVLIAHSVSCTIGTLASLAQPDLFAKLVFIGASPRYLNDTDYVGGFTSEDVGNLLHAMGDNYLAWAYEYAAVAMNVSNKPMLVKEFEQSLSTMRPDISMLIANRIFRSDHRKDVALLNIPVLILQTQEDAAVPLSVSEYLHRAIEFSELRLIPTKGHFPHMTNPTAIIEAIASFLDHQD